MATTVVQTNYPQQSGYPPQQPTIVQVTTPQMGTASNTTTPGRIQRYNKKAGFVTGIMQIIVGGLLVNFGVAAVCLGSVYRVCWSIWGGMCFYIVAGILGVVSRNQSKCVIIAYMVMSILSAVCAGGQMIYDSVAASGSIFWACDFYRWGVDIYYWQCKTEKFTTAMHALAAGFGFAELVIAIVASAFCCAGSCGKATPMQATIVNYAPPPHPGQVIVEAPGSYPPSAAYPPTEGFHPQGQGQPPGYNQHPAAQ